MAKKSAKDEGAKFIEGILAKIPEDKRAAAKEALMGEAIVEEVGSHVLRQSDYDRMADETAKAKALFEQKYNENLKWYEQKAGALQETDALRAKIAELEKTRAAGTSDDGENPVEAALKKIDLKQYVTRTDAEKAMAEALARRDLQYVDFTTTMTELATEHLLNFKEKLDTKALFKLASEKQLTLPAAYAELSADKREAKQAAEAKAREEELEKRIREKVMLENSGRGPYPTPDNNSGYAGDTLAGLKEGKTDYVAAAVQDYYKGAYKQ